MTASTKFPAETRRFSSLICAAILVFSAGVPAESLIAQAEAPRAQPLKAASKLYAANFTHEYRQGSDDA